MMLEKQLPAKRDVRRSCYANLVHHPGRPLASGLVRDNPVYHGDWFRGRQALTELSGGLMRQPCAQQFLSLLFRHHWRRVGSLSLGVPLVALTWFG